jgi:hypothetical protein
VFARNAGYQENVICISFIGDYYHGEEYRNKKTRKNKTEYRQASKIDVQMDGKTFTLADSGFSITFYSVVFKNINTAIWSAYN